MKTHAYTCLSLFVAIGAGCAVDAQERTSSLTAASKVGEPLTAEEMTDPVANDSGRARTATSTGTVDTTSAFFQSLGSNGRTCNSCHVADEGWTITPAGLRARFDATGGADPIFLRLDGADSPTASFTTADEHRAASSNLLSRGTIRVGLPAVRATPTWDIDIEILQDPRNSNVLFPSNGQVSFFRRPLPTTNLRFAATVNWDGRNTPDLTNMRLGLMNQANGATTGHAQAPAPIDTATRENMVDFETGLFFAQEKHVLAGTLNAANAKGGPEALMAQPFAIGENSGDAFNPKVFDIYDAWAGRDGARGDVAEGQRIFNEKTFGPNHDRTCGGCHNATNVGSSSTFRFFDVGISAASRWSGNVPLYRVHQKSNPDNFVDTTDPGRAMITGNFADVNRFKVPSLRGLAGRAPYFHDGSVATIPDVVDHYQQHFGIDFTDTEKRQLAMFLQSL